AGRVARDLRPSAGQRIEHSGLARLRKPDDADGQCHESSTAPNVFSDCDGVVLRYCRWHRGGLLQWKCTCARTWGCTVSPRGRSSIPRLSDSSVRTCDTAAGKAGATTAAFPAYGTTFRRRCHTLQLLERYIPDTYRIHAMC